MNDTRILDKVRQAKVRRIKKMIEVAAEQIKQIKEGTLPKHKHLVIDVVFLEKFIADNEKLEPRDL